MSKRKSDDILQNIEKQFRGLQHQVKKLKEARETEEESFYEGDDSSGLDSDYDADWEEPGTEADKFQNENADEISVDQEIEQMLGQDPNKSKTLEFKIHASLLNRWKHWSSEGLDKDEKEKLTEKYACPPGVEVPRLNPEIAHKLQKHSKIRDDFFEKRQRQAGSALSALGCVMTSLIEEKNSIDRNLCLKRLTDVGMLVSDLIYCQTKSRIALITAGVDKDTRAILDNTKTEEFLFGKDLAGKVNEAKTIEKIALSLKKPAFKNPQDLNYNSLRGRKPEPRQAGSQFLPAQMKRRLQFRPRYQNQPFNSRASYQGQSRHRSQSRRRT